MPAVRPSTRRHSISHQSTHTPARLSHTIPYPCLLYASHICITISFYLPAPPANVENPFDKSHMQNYVQLTKIYTQPDVGKPNIYNIEYEGAKNMRWQTVDGIRVAVFFLCWNGMSLATLITVNAHFCCWTGSIYVILQNSEQSYPD